MAYRSPVCMCISAPILGTIVPVLGSWYWLDVPLAVEGSQLPTEQLMADPSDTHAVGGNKQHAGVFQINKHPERSGVVRVKRIRRSNLFSWPMFG